MRQFVHVDFAGEMICGGSKAAVGSLAQGRLHGMKFDELVGNVIVSGNAGGAGIVVVKFPRGDFSVGTNGAGYLDDSRRPEVGPGEFLFAGPYDLHRLL